MAVPLPLIIGVTSAPKKVLSYRWKIEEAQLLMENQDTRGLPSPEFKVHLPNPDKLKKDKEAYFRCSVHYELNKAQSNVDYDLHLSLWNEKKEPSSQPQQDSGPVKVLITDLKICVVDCETNKSIDTYKESDRMCDLNGPLKEVFNIIVKNPEKCLRSNMLIIQVNATLLCPNDLVQTTSACKQPTPDCFRDHLDPRYLRERAIR